MAIPSEYKLIITDFSFPRLRLISNGKSCIHSAPIAWKEHNKHYFVFSYYQINRIYLHTIPVRNFFSVLKGVGLQPIQSARSTQIRTCHPIGLAYRVSANVTACYPAEVALPV